MWIAVYILSIAGLYLAVRQTARRNDNESKIEPKPEVNYDDGSSGYARGIMQRHREQFYDPYIEKDSKLHWDNKVMVITAIISFVPIINTIGAVWIGCRLFFTHESVKEWFNSESKL